MKRTPLKRSGSLSRTTALKPVGQGKAGKIQRYKAHLQSPEYKAARKEAMERAGHQCEGVTIAMVFRGDTAPPTYFRCGETEQLQAHHLTYPKTRPLTASDLSILCRSCHARIEAIQHSHRHPRRPAV